MSARRRGSGSRVPRMMSFEAGKGRMRLSYDVELKGLFNHLNEIIVEVREDPEDSWKSEKN